LARQAAYSGGRENVLAVRNCCYVSVCEALQRPRGEGRNGGISWRPLAYGLFKSIKGLKLQLRNFIHK